MEILFYLLSLILTFLNFIPFLPSPKWYVRVWDYPRFQMLGIGLVITLTASFTLDFNRWENIVCLVLLGLNFFYLGWIVYPYTFLSSKMVADANKKAGTEKIKLMTVNVYQHNQAFGETLDLIQKTNPDVVFLLETDENWKNAVQNLKKEYEYFIEIPKENTYGMLFYSKIPIKNQEIHYLIDDEIPSIIVDLQFGKHLMRLYGVHPTPPVPQENTESTERDAEILIMGKKSKEFQGPSIVFGDLNDVAWSHTTRLFLRISGMLDPRIGRGMYNTFHTKYPFFRWPLDHFFVSSHFRLHHLKVETGVGSDHFPISIELSIHPKDEEKELETKPDDKEEAQAIIEEAKA